jgi:hypothetical protein
MNKNETYYFIFMYIIAAIALIYHLYRLWFTPEKYSEKLVKGVRDFWPFANFYRKWFASRSFIWLFRITYTLFLLIVLTILALMIFGTLGLLP